MFLATVALVPSTAHAQGGSPGPPSGTPAPEQPPPVPVPELRVERPAGKPLIREGQPTRQLLGGTWYFRQDDELTAGDTERWYAQRDLTGWTEVDVPFNWNAHGRDREPLVGGLVPQGVQGPAGQPA